MASGRNRCSEASHTKSLRMLLHPDGGRLRQGKESQEALHHSPVAYDPQIFGIQRLVQFEITIDYPGQRACVGLDRRVGTGRGAAFDLQPTLRDLGPETVLAETKLVARLETP